MTKENIWDSVINYCLDNNILSERLYDTYLSDVSVSSFEDNVLIIEYDKEDDFYCNFINARYYDILNKALCDVMGFNEEDKHIIFRVASDLAVKEEPVENKSYYISNKPNKNGLVDEYVFENFIVGSSNQMAYAAALAVADDPGGMYNPLYIYGNSGLGKTHLLHAIAHHILDKLPDKKILYVSCETFTNELINAIKKNKQEQFRQKYREIDILLIDDIQFISGKESTQMEFFHTFDELALLKKQIIITSDKLPREIENLDERLSTRFAWGLTCDVKMPELETRIAILEKLAERDNIKVPDDVFLYIAKNIVTSIRDLEGALKRVIIYSKFSIDKKIDLKMAEGALKDILINNSKKELSIEMIQEIVCEYYKIKIDDIKGKTRKADIAQARQVAMYLCRKKLNEGFKQIGKNFGGRDHSTVMHACEKITDDYENNKTVQNQIIEIEAIISSL